MVSKNTICLWCDNAALEALVKTALKAMMTMGKIDTARIEAVLQG